jgi:phospholipase/carboxylesterase
VLQPKIKTGKPRLMILLHGVGGNEQNLFSFANQLPDEFLVVSVRAPFIISEGRYSWYQVNFSTGKPIIDARQAEKSRNTILQFVGELKQQFLFDDKLVYLCGFSQGAIMAYSVGLTAPDIIKGIAIMSGRLLEEVKPLITHNGELEHLQVFVAHGINDATLNIQYAREAHNYLESLNIHPAYKEYIYGHGIDNEMLTDFISWLGKK